jgi:hypothetical protein
MSVLAKVGGAESDIGALGRLFAQIVERTNDPLDTAFLITETVSQLFEGCPVARGGLEVHDGLKLFVEEAERLQHGRPLICPQYGMPRSRGWVVFLA